MVTRTLRYVSLLAFKPCAVALRTLYADRHQQPEDFRSSHSIPNMMDGVTMTDSKVPAYRMSFCTVQRSLEVEGSEITSGPCIIYY